MAQPVRCHQGNSTGWDGRPPAPRLPEGVVRTVREKYLEAYRALTDSLPAHLTA